jgi:hypothetical protein
LINIYRWNSYNQELILSKLKELGKKKKWLKIIELKINYIMKKKI